MGCIDQDAASNWNAGFGCGCGRNLLLLHSVTSSEGLSSVPLGFYPAEAWITPVLPIHPVAFMLDMPTSISVFSFIIWKLNLAIHAQANSPSSFPKPSKQWCWHSHLHTPTFPNFSLKWNRNNFFFQCYRTTESQNCWGRKWPLGVILSNLLFSSRATQVWLPRNFSRWL